MISQAIAALIVLTLTGSPAKRAGSTRTDLVIMTVTSVSASCDSADAVAGASMEAALERCCHDGQRSR